MEYERIVKGRFLKRPNRFLAYVDIFGQRETVHVKNTGRCAELLVPGAEVYVQRSENPDRKTAWDLIAVEKEGRMINMDSQVTNKVVREWIEAGNLFSKPSLIKEEQTYRNSRFDLYVETESTKAFIEVKGVTLEENGAVRFPDAPTERGVKHLEELCRAVADGYEAYLFFVVQMKDVRYFTPNRETHPEFGEALDRARKAGVRIAAFDCEVEPDTICIRKEVPVVLGEPLLYEAAEPIVRWYRSSHRELPWRENVNAYRVWVSEIMLQQTRVEAVKPFYERFLSEFPTVRELAEAEEDKLLKLWEGLGYYNRVRNMQKAARQIMCDFDGEFPGTYEEILSLSGIGSYTAGAISSFAYGLPKPAVDGNVLRVVSRLLADDSDTAKQSVRKRIEQNLEEVIPKEEAGDFNQGLIELGAVVCVPNGTAKCGECPLAQICRARRQNRIEEFPVKTKAKARKIEKKTILLLQDGDFVAICKRPAEGLLAGLYEFPNVEGHLTQEEVIAHSRELGVSPLHIKKLSDAKHIFSHIEWQMTGYAVRVDTLENLCDDAVIFAHPEEIQGKYPIPSAFEKYTKYLDIKIGKKKMDIS